MFRFSNRKALGQGFKCRVRLLVPGQELEIGYSINSTGQDILDEVIKQLDISDKGYYGLKIHDQIQWLDLIKTVAKQTKGMDPVIFDLRFKYYPAEPALLSNENTRYYLYLQLKLDLLEGRLKSSNQDTLAFLIACVLQSELGDRTPDSGISNYVSEYKFVPNQTKELEWEAMKYHQSDDFLGLEPADCELNFLKKTRQLETYGIDPFPVKEGNSRNHYLIGVNYLGITIFQDSKMTSLFSWENIERISLDDKLVLIYCRKNAKKGVKTKPLFGFRCPSHEHAHCFWKIANEHRYFFTLKSTPELPIVTNTGGLFKKSHKLKYTGRVEQDLLRDQNDEPSYRTVKRSQSLISKSIDGPRWQGFSHGTHFQSSSNNIYASEFLNRTMPSNMNCLREEDEDHLEDQKESQQQAGLASKKRPSSGSMAHKDPSTQFTGRRSILTSKNESSADGKLGKDGQSKDQLTHDFIMISIFLAMIFFITFVGILLINDTDRPNSINLLVRKMNLDQASQSLRHNYYLPLKSAIVRLSSQILSAFSF